MQFDKDLMQKQKEEAIEKFKIELKEFVTKNEKGRGEFVNKLTTSYQRTFIKAYNSTSKANAIKAKCLDCTCFQKIEITECATYTCPLWEHRPYKDSRRCE